MFVLLSIDESSTKCIFTNLINDGTNYEFVDKPLDQGEQSSAIFYNLPSNRHHQGITRQQLHYIRRHYDHIGLAQQ